jgi:hypothetical protein
VVCDGVVCGGGVGVTVRRSDRGTPGHSEGRWMASRDSHICFFSPSLVRHTALVDLYISTNGPAWGYSFNWMSGDPCAQEWFGVTCDAENAAVVKLFVP